MKSRLILSISALLILTIIYIGPSETHAGPALPGFPPAACDVAFDPELCLDAIVLHVFPTCEVAGVTWEGEPKRETNCARCLKKNPKRPPETQTDCNNFCKEFKKLPKDPVRECVDLPLGPDEFICRHFGRAGVQCVWARHCKCDP